MKQSTGLSPLPKTKIVVIGGGYSGASCAVQLVRRARFALQISVIEPREHLGRGLAYFAIDPDHRVNGSLEFQAIDPKHPEELLQWCRDNNVVAEDPEASADGGDLFLRRSLVGKYMSDQVAKYSDGNPSGSIIEHVRDSAVDVVQHDDKLSVSTKTHGDIVADMVILATGNPVPGLRTPPFEAGHAVLSNIIANPLAPGYLNAMPTDARVLVVGAGLTALNMISTLLRRDHRGEIIVVTPKGLRPRAQPPEVLGLVKQGSPSVGVLDRVNAPVPDFIAREPLGYDVSASCEALTWIAYSTP